MKRVAELDFLRFIAATMVVFYHFMFRETYAPLNTLAQYGYLGVPLFFMISGFVILWSAQGRTGWEFVKSRFWRLYPMFWLGMLTTLAVMVVAGRAKFSAYDIAANFTMLPGYLGAPMIDGVYWTLAVEFKFYVLVFAMIVLGQMKHIEAWIYAWLMALCVAMIADNGILESLTIYPHGFYFVGGALCYLLHARGMSAPRLLALLVCVAASTYQGILGRSGFAQFADPSAVASIIVVMYAVLLAISLRRLVIPSAPILMTLGALTYPLYLLHNQIGRILLSILDLPPWVALTFVLSLIYALAWWFSRYAEPITKRALSSEIPRVVRSLARRPISGYLRSEPQSGTRDTAGQPPAA